MEVLIPLLALGSLYVVSGQSKSSNDADIEGYEGVLPNTDIPDTNFPDNYVVTNAETDLTSKLATVNKYDTPQVYTDKYFDPVSVAQMNREAGNFGGGSANSRFTSLTGDKVAGDYFQHNNMVPFFGSNLRSRIINENANEGLLDSMQGSGSQYLKKTERSPLFSPNENMQWAHGMPSFSDFEQSRMNVSNKMSNVKPFEEIRVRPGMGADQESLGFNSGMMAREMWMPKTADQMRASNNPKPGGLSLAGHEGPALSAITNRGYHAAVEKNRPDRVRDLSEAGQAGKYLTTTMGAAGSAATLHYFPVDRPEEHRASATMSYTGAAGRDGLEATYVDGEYMPTHRQQFGEVPLGPVDAGKRSDLFDSDFGAKSAKKYTNNRSTANVDDYFGIVGGALGAVVAPLLDVLRPSKKQNTVGTLRPYQNAESTVKNSYLLNPGDRPAPTIRETTENSKGHMFINSGQERTAYMVTKPMDVYTNRRDTTTSYGGAASGAKELRPYDAEYRQRNNEIKSSTIDGRMVPGNMSLLQTDVNVRSKPGMESDLRNRRTVTPSMPYSTPSSSMIGEMKGQQQLYSGANLDRSEAYVLSALKSNPYAMQPLTGY